MCNLNTVASNKKLTRIGFDPMTIRLPVENAKPGA
jgi:hypothetical protein